MTAESFLNGKVTLFAGDMLAGLPTLPENSVDSCVTDPPYHLTSIVQRFGAEDAAPAKSNGATGIYKRASSGFMGKQWDGGDIAFRPEAWAEVYRVLKPGAHLLAFGGTRTYHRMACAIEDAGFEVRDCIFWCFGSGFPKSHDVAQSIEKKLTLGAYRRPDRDLGGLSRHRFSGDIENSLIADTGGKLPLTAEAAAQWEGWGTALKPAVEPIVLARKPLGEGTVAANVLRWGCGALNVDGCRVAGDAWQAHDATGLAKVKFFTNGDTPVIHKEPHKLGRWPANLIHDGSEEVVAAFPESVDGVAVQRNGGGQKIGGQGIYGGSEGLTRPDSGYGSSGSAARFFYTAKADSDDRLGSKHPTVKPLDLMQWLVRLVTPRNGRVLDPFAGTGTTGEAAWREGFAATLIEREEEYQRDIRRRMALALAGPDERVRESVKARGLVADAGPLFGGTA